jgi:hypothetical protein
MSGTTIFKAAICVPETAAGDSWPPDVKLLSHVYEGLDVIEVRP